MVETLLRNLVAGNLAARRGRYWLMSEQRGMLRGTCGQGYIETSTQSE